MRPDLQVIADLSQRAHGCWTWAAATARCWSTWSRDKGVKGRGIELSEAGVLACVRRGLSVRQGNLEEGLGDYPAAASTT